MILGRWNLQPYPFLTVFLLILFLLIILPGINLLTII